MKKWAIARMADFESNGTRVPAIAKYRTTGELITDFTDPNQKACPANVVQNLTLDWALVKFGIAHLAVMTDDADIYLIPEINLDNTLSTIPGGTRTTMRNKLEAAGFSFAGVQWTWSMRELLVFLRKQLQAQAGDNIEDSDIPDPA